ncbi:MAG: [FeFe] hydrogenase H-cluster maturation GTPase HydF [Kineothrix sp.]
MGEGLQQTPSANRLHIGVFGRANSGKSTFINALTGQQVSIVSETAGTTTDPVYKAMELHPIGACVLMDTAGFDDTGELGEKRVEKTRLASEKADIAILFFPVDALGEEGKFNAGHAEKIFQRELYWYHLFRERKTPVLLLIGKAEKKEATELYTWLKEVTGEEAISVSAKTGAGIEKVKEELARKLPENYGNNSITGNLVQKGDLVLLVMPQDIQAPKGRLILPQVQTIRELLDKGCLIMSVTKDELPSSLAALSRPPKLIITDSQVFGYVYENKPEESMLTSFSVLFAAYKGDLPYYVEGARKIDSLTAHSRVLIAECCTHAPLKEDIGRVKLPRMLKKRFGDTLITDIVSGTDFPEDLTGYDLIIQCGACMFNRKYVISRIDRAKKQDIPMTNYGVAIAHLTGILEQVSMPN